MKSSRVYLLYGTEHTLVINELNQLLHKLGHSGSTSQNFNFEEYSFPPIAEENPMAQALDACRTPSLLADSRLVVLKGLEQASSSQIATLADFISGEHAMDDCTTFVLVSAGKKPPASLIKAATAVGETIDADPKSGSKGKDDWYTTHLNRSQLTLTGDAVKKLKEHLGEDLSRVESVFSLLVEAYGVNATVTGKDLEPFLGAEGGSAPWDLTDAIDAANGKNALHHMARLLENERHPLQVLSILQRHYQAMIRLDGLFDIDAAAAAKITKLALYPATKALKQSRLLGPAKLSRAMQLLKDADLAIKGFLGLDARVVLEITILRLSQLPKLKNISLNS